MEKLFGYTQVFDDEHWISISDIMAGLMVVFLFVAISYIRPIVETQNNIKDIAVTWKNSEVEIHKALYEEFEYDLPIWQAELDSYTLSIRFTAPEILFDSATTKLKSEFKNILEDFFPRYLRILYEFNEEIAEIRIEGHTSSVWEGANTENEAYFNNMELSQSRTRSVLRFVFDLPEITIYKDWAKKLITANGLSSSQLIYKDDLEDYERSRRVEFRVRTNSKEQIVKILETMK